MTEIIKKMSPGIFAYYDDVTGRSMFINKPVLVEEKRDLQARIAASPNPTDAELLVWAKANYPMIDHTAERARIAEINVLLDLIKPLESGS